MIFLIHVLIITDGLIDFQNLMQSREILRSKGPRASHQRVIPNLLQTHAHKFQRTEKLKAKKSPEVPIPQRNTSIRAIKVRPSFVNSS